MHRGRACPLSTGAADAPPPIDARRAIALTAALAHIPSSVASTCLGKEGPGRDSVEPGSRSARARPPNDEGRPARLGREISALLSERRARSVPGRNGRQREARRPLLSRSNDRDRGNNAETGKESGEEDGEHECRDDDKSNGA
jgi:hypothetical protein